MGCWRAAAGLDTGVAGARRRRCRRPRRRARHGMAGLPLPVDDLRAPSPAQLDAALDFIDEQRLLGRRVLVHCLVGQGRTGTILAAYLIRGGLDADEALREVRAVCPDAVGSAEQEAALREFAAQRAWVF